MLREARLDMNELAREQTLRRLATAQGHLRGVEQMARDGAPCPQVIYQLRAVCSALEHIEASLIEEHLYDCLSSAKGIKTEEVLTEIMQIWTYSPTPRGSKA